LPGGREGTAVWLDYTPANDEHDDEHPQTAGQPVTVLVAAEPIEVRHTLRLLGWLLTAACISAVVIMGTVLMRVVSAGVQPVKSLASEIESLTEADLGRRFPRGGVPDELLPVVDKLNGLLHRLEGAFTREKSFTADVAHELRTPLTGLRMTLEVCRSQPRKTLAYETAIDECRAIIDRMEAMVESLLLLARSDAGHMALARQPVELRQLILTSWALFQDRAEALGVMPSIDLSDSSVVETDGERLNMVLRNLLDNAVSYVNPGGKIRVTTHPEAGDVVIEIANTGSLIAAEDAPRLFERFWRGDIARTEAGTHCGLGLSLCRRLMDLLGGEISVTTSSGGEFVCQLRLKLATAQPQPV
jgi:signal transduction histidine kinase